MLDTEKSSTEMTYMLDILSNPNEIRELRVLHTNKGTVSGYFSDNEALAKAAQNYNGKFHIYVTLNPVMPALLARAENRVIERAKQTISDADIAHRYWLLVDFDPVRPSGISSTKEEHQAAVKLAKQVKAALLKQGWPAPLLADSGNGAHLIYYIDLPNTHESTELAKKVLQVLDLRFSTDQVQIDTTTYNAARICKLYGTIACKGDNTQDRPHRLSQILDCPKELAQVSVEQLQTVANHLPTVKEPQKKAKKTAANHSDFNLETWLDKHEIQVTLKAPWQNKATKYVLESCPWNEAHTNQSAYIIHFDSGGIAAGCHHNSCSHHTWETLRDLLEPDWRHASGESKGGEETQADILIQLGDEATFFRNDIEEAFAAVEINGHTELWKVKSRPFKLWLTKKFFEKTGKSPGTDAMNRALGVMEMKAMFEGDQHSLQLRVAELDGAFYYDLADKRWRVVEIRPQGCSILDKPPILFVRNKNLRAQAEPDFEGDLRLVLNHVRLKDSDDQLLYLVYLVTCLIPNIPHPVLVLSGEKGASKSTTMRMTRAIIDPAARDLLTMPNSKQDLALSIANNYMPCFDNLDTLSAEKSDLLCIASTGGGFSKRTLYSDDDETILEFLRCVGLNGINVVATRADLLDRSIVIELERIDESQRKEEKEVWKAFDAAKPSIVGGALQALSKAMETYPTLQLDKLARMADFTRWGYAIAEALGLGGERFLEAYFNNQNKSNDEAVSAHPVAAAVLALMKGRHKYEGTVAELLKDLEMIALKEKINVHVPSFPKAAHMLSRRLKEVKSNLKQLGIVYDIRHAGDAKVIHIEKLSSAQGNNEDETSSLNEITLPKKRPQLAIREWTDLEDLFEDEM